MSNGYEQSVGTVFVGEDRVGYKAFYQRTSTGLAEVTAVYSEVLQNIYPVKVVRVVGNIQADEPRMMSLHGEAF
jgi:hypothetical protein